MATKKMEIKKISELPKLPELKDPEDPEDPEEKIKIKNCPGANCGLPVEKKGGCNFIRCPLCKTRWCWVCNKEKGPAENQCFNRKHRSHR